MLAASALTARVTENDWIYKPQVTQKYNLRAGQRTPFTDILFGGCLLGGIM